MKLYISLNECIINQIFDQLVKDVHHISKVMKSIHRLCLYGILNRYVCKFEILLYKKN